VPTSKYGTPDLTTKNLYLTMWKAYPRKTQFTVFGQSLRFLVIGTLSLAKQPKCVNMKELAEELASSSPIPRMVLLPYSS
jgi:hypothetical protein